MQSIKALVIFMGLLILAGLGLLVYGMVNQVSEVAGPSGPVARDDPGGFDEVEIPLPAGCSVVETRIDGNRLVVRTDGPDGNEPCRKIIIIDLESGEVLGRVQFKLGS
jgi:hypothetical protein